MYWPIGAPKTYAALKQSGGSRYLDRNHDQLGSERAQQEEDDVHTVNGSQEQLSPDEKGGDYANGDGTHRRASPSGIEDHAELGSRHEEDQRDAANFPDSEDIVDIKVARAGHVFATITETSLSVWQTKPPTLLGTVLRAPRSLETYGRNTALLLRPDALIIVVQTERGFLITYSLATDPGARVYQTHVYTSNGSHARRPSTDGLRNLTSFADCGPAEMEGFREVNIRFRMVIRIDAGISKALVLDDELVVATVKPAAVQCIRWAPDSSGSSHSTELLKRMTWLTEKSTVVDMFYDKPMNLHAWITGDGKVYAVQRLSGSKVDSASPKSLFKGYCFHEPSGENDIAVKAAINARFSLIAVACADCSIRVYSARDYSGNIPPSHDLRLPVSASSSGQLTFMTYSPDGYSLFAGFENGWAMWSVYGKPGASTFGADTSIANANHDRAICGMKDGFWIGGGCEILLLGSNAQELYLLEMARSSITGCFAMSSLPRSLLQGSTSLLLYKGFDASDLTTISGENTQRQMVQVPQRYLAAQWPLRLSVISPDGRYVAVAGRRGLAHYSVGSGRWKTFEDSQVENGFTVRGGMAWWQHILVAAVETDNSYQVRLYSRDQALDNSHVLHTEQLSYPVVCLATSGEDSLLVYTYENVLLHYIFLSTPKSITLAQVGQIAFHGIIRAPPRVRGISWILPDDQRESGDPSQDVATASVLFLVDAKLVLLQPSANEYGELKYDMRVIAHDVEYYTLSRELPQPAKPQQSELLPGTPETRSIAGFNESQSLRDSLWYFDGRVVQVWPEILDVLSSAPSELGRDLPPTVQIATDFYPLSTMTEKGVLTGVESDLVQRRNFDFSFFKLSSRTHLFIPPILRYHLAQYDSPAALHLSHSYRRLPYFAHSLEILLHDVLDKEVDLPPESSDTALLPSVLSFLSSFPAYLDIIAGCTRKTELRSWQTLFRHLPPVQSLFEESLQRGMLKTAGSYLLILHAFDEGSFNRQQIATLLRKAQDARDWELCKELARFLVGIDSTGKLLESVLVTAGSRLHEQANGKHTALLTGTATEAAGLGSRVTEGSDRLNGASQRNGVGVKTNGELDYFSN